LFSDVQMAYNKMLENYKEENIIVLGYSIGSGIASKLASVNSPKQLILQAPYFSMVDMMRQEYPFVPTFLLKYKLNTNEYIKNCDMPITLFHGKEDAIIDVNSSLKLNKLIKSTDELIILENQGHNGITDNVEYQKVLRRILN
jgi:esterase/lipase